MRLIYELRFIYPFIVTTIKGNKLQGMYFPCSSDRSLLQVTTHPWTFLNNIESNKLSINKTLPTFDAGLSFFDANGNLMIASPTALIDRSNRWRYIIITKFVCRTQLANLSYHPSLA